MLKIQELVERGETYRIARKPGKILASQLVSKGLLKKVPNGLAATTLLKAIYAFIAPPELRGEK
mgnify:CR=1 FL=1